MWGMCGGALVFVWSGANVTDWEWDVLLVNGF